MKHFQYDSNGLKSIIVPFMAMVFDVFDDDTDQNFANINHICNIKSSTKYLAFAVKILMMNFSILSKRIAWASTTKDK